MNKCNRLFFLVITCITVLGLSSCFKKDVPIILPPNVGNTVSEQACLGSSGDTTLFYNLKLNKIVKKSATFSWDLCFESNTTTDAVFMNGGKGVRMYNTHLTNFNDVNSALMPVSASPLWNVDKPSLLTTSSYIGDWKGKGEIFILKNESENLFRKIRIVNANENSITIESAGIDQMDMVTSTTLTKNKSCNYTYYSFATNEVVTDFEPEDITSWDFMFTQYAFIYENLNNFTYAVKGVLLNPYNTLGYGDTTKLVDFNSVTLQQAEALPLVKDRDVIGYLWKSLLSISGDYVVNDKFLYLVQTQNNELYKLHFLSYYSSTGESHTPKFEFQRLK